MTWDAWGMFTGALEQYNDDEETVVKNVNNDWPPDSEPPPTVWPESPPLEFVVAPVVDLPATIRPGQVITLPQAHASFAVMESCAGCGASKLKHLYCLHCGHPNMTRCPNGDKPCVLCRGHVGWVEELKP